MTRKEYNDNVELWSSHVYRFAVWNCGDTTRGEDAMQEAFATLWEKRERVSVEQGLGFLLTVARRYLVDCFRHDLVAEAAHRQLAQREEAVPSAEERYSQSEMLQKALCRLPEVQRSILQLRDVEGYSYKEIAEQLELSLQQVEVYLFRARVAMKKMIQST